MNLFNNAMLIHIYDFIINTNHIKQYDIDKMNTNKLILLLATKSYRSFIINNIMNDCKNEIKWIFDYYYNPYKIIESRNELENLIFKNTQSIHFKIFVDVKNNNNVNKLICKYYVHIINDYEYLIHYYFINSNYAELIFHGLYTKRIINKSYKFMIRNVSDMIMYKLHM